MSGSILPIVTGFGAAAVDGLVSILFRPARRIGILFPNVVLNEHHVDTLSVTRHPVQQGANISDHAYKEPAVVTIQGAWSSSSYSALLNTANFFTPNLENIIGTLTDGLLGPSYLQQVYSELLQLQEDRELMDVITGKRAYSNMLLTSLEVHTDKESEFTLMFRATCQQILIANSTTTTLPAASLQRNPASTAPITPTGQVSPQSQDTRSGARTLGDIVRGLTGG